MDLRYLWDDLWTRSKIYRDTLVVVLAPLLMILALENMINGLTIDIASEDLVSVIMWFALIYLIPCSIFVFAMLSRFNTIPMRLTLILGLFIILSLGVPNT